MSRPIAAPYRPAAAAQVHPIYGRLLRVLLEQVGADGERVLAAAGIDAQALMTDDARLGLDLIARAAEMAVQVTGRPWIGLDLGGQAPVTAHGSVGYAATTARDGREVLRTLARFGALRNDAFEWQLEEERGTLSLLLRERVPLGRTRQVVIDGTISATVRVLEAALGPLGAGCVIELPLPAPAWAEQYRRFGAASLRFDAPVLRVRLDAGTLARPCLGADARAHEAACRACEDARAELDGGRLGPRVAALLAAAPMTALPSLPDVASQCGVSPRTLIRRLKAEGTGYQPLVDALRQERARWLLEHTARPIEHIAEELGFLDTSNFSRTVRRWFGTTPRALRTRGAMPEAMAVPSPSGQ